MVKRIAEETVKESHISDSLKDERTEFPISKDQQIIERKKVGEDSLFLVRSVFLAKGKYSECWYKGTQLHGLSKFYYSNGNLSHSFVYKNALLMDVIESNFPDGSPRADSKLKNGTGNLKIYHPITFKLYVDCDIKDGTRNGKYISYYANGNAHENYILFNDSAIGDYTIKYKSGVVKSQRREIKGKTVTSEFYPNSKIKRSSIFQDNTYVSDQLFDEAGNVVEEVALKNNEAMGVKRVYSLENKLLSKGNYVNGKKHGSYEYFHEDGTKKAVEYYIMDEITSEKRWNDNGTLALEATYKDGAYDGLFKDYYPNGKPRREQYYVKGVKEGKYTSYFDNGNKYNEGNFVDGKLKGPLKIYTRDGKFDRVQEY